jgi:hypothetical protein
MHRETGRSAEGKVRMRMVILKPNSFHGDSPDDCLERTKSGYIE